MSKSDNKPSNSHLTPEEIKYFQKELLIKRAEILGDVDSMEAEALRKSRLDAAGDLSSMPIHMADIGTDNYEQEFALGLLDSERKMLRDIDDALLRIEEGTYGICEGTDKPINKNRLEANPWARYCIEYAQMVEKGLVEEGEKVQDEDEDEDDYGYDDDLPDLEGEDEDEEDLDGDYGDIDSDDEPMDEDDQNWSDDDLELGYPSDNDDNDEDEEEDEDENF